MVRVARARSSCEKPRRPRQPFRSRPNALPFDTTLFELRASDAFTKLQIACVLCLQFPPRELNRTVLAFSITGGLAEGDQPLMSNHSSPTRFLSRFGGIRLPFFYGWLLVAVAFVTMAVGVNARTAFSLLFPAILAEFALG